MPPTKAKPNAAAIKKAFRPVLEGRGLDIESLSVRKGRLIVRIRGSGLSMESRDRELNALMRVKAAGLQIWGIQVTSGGWECELRDVAKRTR